MPDTMNAVVIDRFGGVDVLQPRSVPVPRAEAGEVLIKIEHAGVGVWDPFEREGGFAKHYGIPYTFPHVLGSDAAGTVAAVGDGVADFKVGDRVYAFTIFNPKGGAYAEYVAVKAAMVSKIPGDLSTEAAAAMAVDAMTALRGLDDALGVKAAESVMVFGAGGGIGHLAVQLARRMGARVFAVASGDDGVALAKKLGAEAVANGRTEDVVAAARAFAPGGLDAALLTAGGEAANLALTALKSGGRAAHPNGVMPLPVVPAGVSLKAYDGDVDRAAIEKLNRLISAGPFTVHVARAFPLASAADAQRALSDHYLGKLVLRVN